MDFNKIVGVTEKVAPTIVQIQRPRALEGLNNDKTSVRNALWSKKQAKRLRYVFVNFVHFCGGKSVRHVVVENIPRV